MRFFPLKHRKFTITLCILIIIYIAFPMAYQGMGPSKIFNINPSEITAIEITNHQNGNSIVIKEPREIETFVKQLNDRRYLFWSFDGPVNVTPEILHIYKGLDYDVYFVGPYGIQNDMIVFYTDMNFVTEYLAH